MTDEERLKKILEERAKNSYGHGGIINTDPNSLINSPQNVANIRNSQKVEIATSNEPENIDRYIYYTNGKKAPEEIKYIPITFYEEPFDIELKEGVYISFKDFINALEKELSYDKQDSFFVAWRTGEVVSKRQMINQIIERVIKSHNHLKATKHRIDGVPTKEIVNININSEGKKSEIYIRNLPQEVIEKIKIGDIFVDVHELELALAEYLKLDKIRIMDPRKKPRPPRIFEPEDFIKTPKPPKGPEPTPRGPELTPRGPELTPRGPELTPRGPELTPRGPELTPRGPELTPKGPELTPKGPELTPKGPELTPKGPEFTPRGPEPTPGNNEKTQKLTDKIYTVILRKYRVPDHLLQALLSSLLALITFLTALGWEDEKIEKYIEEKSVSNDYSFSQLSETSFEDRYKEALDQSKIEIGKKSPVADGTVYHESSDWDFGGKNRTGKFGNTARPAGDYTIESISAILPDGTIVATYKDGVNLAQYAKEVAKNNNIDVNDIIFRVHLTDPVAGWVEFKDIGNLNKDYHLDTTKVTLEESEKIDGIDHNFNGNTITFENDNNSVTVKVVDDFGNMLSPGTIVTGSDGKQYRINEMLIAKLSSSRTETIVTGKKLTFKLSNIAKEEALALAGLTALAAALGFLVKKNKEEYAQLTETQIDDLVTIAEKRYNETSEFNKAVQTITGRTIDQSLLNQAEQNLSPEAQTLKDSLIAQEITLEQIGEMRGSR